MTEFNLPSWDCAAALANDEADLYSVAVPDGKYSMRRHPLAKDGLIGLPLPLEPEVTTLPKLLQRAGRKFANRKGFGWRIKNSDGSWGPYEFITFQQFVNRATAFGAGLRAMCPWLNDQDRVGVYGKNELNWAVAQHGIYHQNLTVVPIYDTFGEEAVKYIIEHAELSVVVVSKANLSALAHTVEGMDVVKMIVLFDFPEGKDAPPFTRLLSVPEIMSHGEKVMHDASAPEVRPEGVCLIMYTSGTTGPPKGVVLTHANMMAALAGTLHGLASEVTCDDVHISYLPLAHALENALHMVALARGCAVGFYKGDPRTLVDDVAALRPTLFAGVPRVYQRIHSLVLQKFQAKPWPLRQLIAKALRDQADACRRREGRSCLWDALVFRKVKAALGGRVRLFVTGSAPLSPVLQEFIQVCFGCPVHEGYGLTETSGVSHLCDPRDMNIGHVGGPMVSCEMRLESVPDMNYSTDDLPCPRGEVLLRGPSIMNGYYKSPGLTAEVLDEDGWLHTGDIGRFNRNGSLSIIDRKKNMFKLSQGEYISSERLEGIFLRCPLVGQIFVYGNSYKDCIVAVVVPDPVTLIPRCGKAGMPNVVPFKTEGWQESFEALCKSLDVNTMILAEIKGMAREANLKGFEMPKALHLEGSINDLNQGFNVENDLLTSTFKMRRPALLAKYQNAIDKLYLQLEGR